MATYVLGGGTFNHVRSHLALAAPAFGGTAKTMTQYLTELGVPDVRLVLTKMAGGESIVTNSDVSEYLDILIKDPQTRCIVFNVALCDFEGQIGEEPSGKYSTRLKSREGSVSMNLTPAEKLISRVRVERKDIFLVGFKTTCGATPDEQYLQGLGLLKGGSINLVLANDIKTRHNMIITPEESRYGEGNPRNEVLKELARMTASRMQCSFTRSEVVPGERVAWSDSRIPENLREVVNYCIGRGAYKPFRGNTAGHFAIKTGKGSLITSIRKSNFNHLSEVGMVEVETLGDNHVRAFGAKPSVGGQSQRIIFQDHPAYDCIVHFHCPPLPSVNVSTRPQWPYECGSHECGKNTSDGLSRVDLGDGHELSVVYLDKHGPNIVFHQSTPAEKVQRFIDRHFDLSAKTGGRVDAA